MQVYLVKSLSLNNQWCKIKYFWYPRSWRILTQNSDEQFDAAIIGGNNLPCIIIDGEVGDDPDHLDQHIFTLAGTGLVWFLWFIRLLRLFWFFWWALPRLENDMSSDWHYITNSTAEIVDILTYCGIDMPIQHHKSWSTLVQIRAWCLTSPSPYLNQCWFDINRILCHSQNLNFTSNDHNNNQNESKTSIHYTLYWFEETYKWSSYRNCQVGV